MFIFNSKLSKSPFYKWKLAVLQYKILNMKTECLVGNIQFEVIIIHCDNVNI